MRSNAVFACVGLIVAGLLAGSCSAEGGGTAPPACPSKQGNVFLLLEWNNLPNATLTAPQIVDIFRTQLPPMLTQTPGFVELIGIAVSNVTTRLIVIFSNSQQLNAARDTITMFVANNLVSQFTLVRSLQGTVQLDVFNQNLCALPRAQLENSGRYAATRIFSISPALAGQPSLSMQVLTQQAEQFAIQSQQQPGFREFILMVAEGVTPSQAVWMSVYDTQAQAVQADGRLQEFVMRPPLAGQLSSVQADVALITFDRLAGV